MIVFPTEVLSSVLIDSNPIPEVLNALVLFNILDGLCSIRIEEEASPLLSVIVLAIISLFPSLS